MVPNTQPVINLHNFVKSVKTQNENDSAAHATLGMFRCLLALQTPPVAAEDELSSKFLYYNLTVMAGHPGKDVGSSISAAINSLSTTGVCTEDNWPYSMPLSTEPTPEVYSDAQGNKIRASHVVNQTLEDLIGCLSTAHPFAFCIATFPSTFSDAVAKSGNIPMPGDAEVASGAECLYCIGVNQGPTVGFSDGKSWPGQSFLCQASRGPGFGLTAMAGCVTIPYAYLTDPSLAFDFNTIDVEV
jgi:hypothetical protein